MIFLIQYNRKEGAVITLKRFTDSERESAERERLDLELSQIRSGLSNEIVLLEADSESDLRRTHRRYFEKVSQIAST